MAGAQVRWRQAVFLTVGLELGSRGTECKLGFSPSMWKWVPRPGVTPVCDLQDKPLCFTKETMDVNGFIPTVFTYPISISPFFGKNTRFHSEKPLSSLLWSRGLHSQLHGWACDSGRVRVIDGTLLSPGPQDSSPRPEFYMCVLETNPRASCVAFKVNTHPLNYISRPWPYRKEHTSFH